MNDNKEKKKYRYKVKKGNIYEAWTGKFTEKGAKEWYEKFGKFHEERGHILKRFVYL